MVFIFNEKFHSLTFYALNISKDNAVNGGIGKNTITGDTGIITVILYIQWNLLIIDKLLRT